MILSHAAMVTCCYGDWLLTECAAGYYGLGCEHRCLCANNASCDVVSGSCDCLPGWTGSACNQGSRQMSLQLVLEITKYVLTVENDRNVYNCHATLKRRRSVLSSSRPRCNA